MSQWSEDYLLEKIITHSWHSYILQVEITSLDYRYAAFERCADVITSLILKYGPALKRKWNLNEWIRNIQAESLWKDIACKRYQRYFIHMMNMNSVPV